MAEDLTLKKDKGKSKEKKAKERPEWGSNKSDERKRIPNSQRDPHYEKQRQAREARIARRREELQQQAQAPKLHTASRAVHTEASRSRLHDDLDMQHKLKDEYSDSEATMVSDMGSSRRDGSYSPPVPAGRNQRSTSPPIPTVLRRQRRPPSPLPALLSSKSSNSLVSSRTVPKQAVSTKPSSRSPTVPAVKKTLNVNRVKDAESVKTWDGSCAPSTNGDKSVSPPLSVRRRTGSGKSTREEDIEGHDEIESSAYGSATSFVPSSPPVPAVYHRYSLIRVSVGLQIP